MVSTNEKFRLNFSNLSLIVIRVNAPINVKPEGQWGGDFDIFF